MRAGLLIGMGGASAGGGVAASLTDHTITHSNVNPPCTAALRVNSDGSVKNHANFTLEAWLDSGINSQFEVMVDTVTGDGLDVASDATGVWLSCATSRYWALSTSRVSDLITDFRCRIRNASSLVVLTTANIELQASSAGGGHL